MACCVACDKYGYINFPWKDAAYLYNAKTAAIADNLRHQRRLKFGHLFQCGFCGQYWFLDADGVDMHKVPTERTELFFAWAETPLHPSADHLEWFHRIGATECDFYGAGRRELWIPCHVLTESGREVDRALAVISKAPPIVDWRSHTLLGNTVSVVRRSDYALLLDVRIATMNAREVTFGFMPTLVESFDHRLFILSGIPNFLGVDDLLGKDISLPAGKADIPRDTLIIGEDVEKVVFVYYDWFDGCEALIRNSA